MNKRIFILSAAILICIGANAQSNSNGIDAILRQIEANNKELQANAQLISSQKLENRTGNNLPDPTLSYSYLWGPKNSGETVGELTVSQSFDFPTLYTTRSKMNRLKTGALDAQAIAMRQQILLQAKEACLDIIMLQRQQQLLDERLKNAEELSAMYAKRLATGDANILETNKINLELLNVRTEARMNSTALSNKLNELIALNGNRPLIAPDDFEQTEYPTVPLPTDFRQVCDELLATDPTMQSLHSESAAARKQISASKQGWLPKLELGYRRNTETGHPLNGIVVGFSFPLFENRNKVKIAKTQASGIDYQKENVEIQASSTLWKLYEEVRNLHASMEEYQRTFQQQQDLSLLKQALVGGQISMIEYFVEISVVYQSKTNLLQLENQYQKAMAQIYKSRL
ncbi:MAG: TolC family protein [Bacteroides sp.]|nr:TolC family protein [Bacteroides sp.]